MNKASVRLHERALGERGNGKRSHRETFANQFSAKKDKGVYWPHRNQKILRVSMSSLDVRRPHGDATAAGQISTSPGVSFQKRA